jgi:di/tricarboxylate transporter
MTTQIAIVLAVVAGVFVVFWAEWLSAELIGLIALVTLIATGVIDSKQAFSGFGSGTLIQLAGALILSESLIRNGAGERIAHRIQRLSEGGSEKMIGLLLTAVTSISAFISNLATAAMFLPVSEHLSRTYRVSPSRLLMPIAYSALLGGIITLTGTSTNMAVSDLLVTRGFRELGVFEMTPVGLPIAVAGMVYLVIVSRWIPGRGGTFEAGKDDDSRSFMSELIVPEGSPAIGRTLRELELERRYTLTPIGLIRGAVRLSEGVFETPLRASDVVVVEARAAAINRGVAAAGLIRKPSSKTVVQGGNAPAVVEATINFNSPLVGRTLREVDLRGRYGIDVIAIWRRGGAVIEKIGDIPLRLGDDVLIQGQLDRIRELAHDPLGLILDDSRVLPRYERKKEWLSIGLFAAVLVLSDLFRLPLDMGFLVGALLVIMTGCLTLDEAYRSLNMRLLIMIGSMLGVAKAIEQSGADRWMADLLLGAFGGADASPIVVMAVLYWLTVVLTQPAPNAAAAVLVLPLALSAAATLGVDHRAFAIAVTIAASLGFLTPLEPACLLVMSTGRYRFRDFFYVGLPLTVLCFLIAMLLLPTLFPFR